MKKWMLSGLIAVLLVSTFLGYKQLDTQQLRPNTADYHNYTLAEMEELATVIVEADWEKVRDSIIELDERDKLPLDARTFSTITVTNVVKGDELVKEGDELQVVEYYATWRDWAGAYVKFPNELYMPLRKGNHYLLFLYQSPEEPSGSYEIIGNHQGKFTFPSNMNTVSTPSLDELDIAKPDKCYSDLYTEISEKYFSPNNEISSSFTH